LGEIADASGISKTDTVLEIGCGAGALTRELAKRANKVIGYEIDQKLKPVLDEQLEEFDNVNIVYKDVLKEDFNALENSLGKDYVMCANLPYYITTPIIMKFIENSKNIKAMIVMVQEEVALRLVSKAGTSDFGAITVGINLRGKAEIIKRVGREMFTPAPNVDSAVVKITFDRDKFKGVDYNAVRNTVKIAFMNRRKMLVNNLMNAYKINRDKAESVLNQVGIPLTSRGETLDALDFVRLTDALKEIGDK
jgi:16S rRNA (adenine1518-N6/adenine1519-N6)-dimethyltransferase